MKTFRQALFYCAVLAALIPHGVAAQSLTVVNVNDSTVACLFASSCTVTPTDTTANYPPATGYTGHPILQTRTFLGAAGTTAAGLTAYVYRVDFTAADAASDINCAVDLTVNIGRIAKLPYSRSGRADVFVITTGGLGTVGLQSAVRSGKLVTFTFTSPVCPNNGVSAPGQSSFFFGLAAKGAPRAVKAASELTFGGGVVKVRTRAPVH